MKSGLYSRAENMLISDKCRDRTLFQLVARDEIKLLSEYFEFSSDDFSLICAADDGIELTMKLKIKNFKRFFPSAE